MKPIWNFSFLFIELFGMTRNINDLSASQTTTKMFSNLFLESQLNTEKQVCFLQKNGFHNTNES